ncbi:MAG: lipid-A-disaccharide synthase, partial [Cycloclasticus sp.]|nr:lipid-A-disaccharide synthase [Cycloclasticus sp.]
IRDRYQAGIKTVHYVSPTVWAWRPKRIKKLIGSLNALLCIFPFEETYFKGTAVPAHFIGHPLADKLSVNKLTQLNVREGLGVSISATVLTLMPGSRLGEIQRHALIFIQAAKICSEHLEGLKVLVPLADKATEELFREIYHSSGITLDLEIVLGESSSAISAADTVLVASGTATLEVMLLKKPMVVAYKLSTLTAWVIRYFKLLKARYVSMPNLIANKPLVKEFLQESATPGALAEELLRLMTDKKDSALMTEQFAKMAGQLALNTDHQAATIVSGVISQRRSS